jgi:hypothetical protein
MENQNEPLKKKWYKRWWAIVFYVFVFLLVVGGLQDNGETNEAEQVASQEPVNQTANAESVKNVSEKKQLADIQTLSVQEQKNESWHEIVKKDIYDAADDYVAKAQAEGQGTLKTISNMPLFKEEKLKVLIPAGLGEEDIKNTIRDIYDAESRADDRLDRITITAYDKRENIESEGSYLSHSYWEKSDEELDKNDKDVTSFRWGRIHWSYVSEEKPVKLSGESSDRDRQIYYRHVELMNNMSDIPISEIDAQSAKDYETIGKEFGISSKEAEEANDRFFESKPTDGDMMISKACASRNDNQVAEEFGITENKVKAIKLYVFNWEAKQPL